ncbi:hypothetical protein V2J09_023983 [Rumex salicifolius]
MDVNLQHFFYLPKRDQQFENDASDKWIPEMSLTKGLDPAFQGVGQKPGTEIWRIENFQPVPLPKSDYGKFYTGDSYIVMQTSGRGGAFAYDIHFWLGKDTTQDEAGTAAIKTVELDASLGGKAVQHREVQGHESDKFLSYFKPCIIPLEGGIASGFKKPEKEEFETRLYICKGKRVVKVKQVPFSRSSLNHDDVFMLDTKDKIYQFNGANSNIQERAKALEVTQYLKDTYHKGVCDVAVVDDGKLQAETDSGEFWVCFGGFAPIGRKVVSDDDIVPEATPAKLYSVAADGKLEPIEGEISKGKLENHKCYILDCGNEIYSWFGRATQVDERKSASQAAEDLLTSQGRPKATSISHVIQGYESNSFKSYFDSWPMGSTVSAEEGRGKAAAFWKQQGGKGASKGDAAHEEVPPLLEAGGKIDVWRIDGSKKTPVPKEDIGKFYSGDCYIVLYTYHSNDKREDFFLCWWIGKDSVEEEQEAASQLATAMFNSMKGRPVHGRIFQGKEPPQFIALFQPMIVLKGGLSSGYKSHLETKGLKDETYAADTVALFRVSGTSSHNNRVIQVDTVATSLNSYECCVLQTSNAVFAWQGSQSLIEQQQLVVKVAEIIKPGGPLKHAKEGTETSVFWSALGGKQSFESEKSSQNTIRDPQLFAFTMEEIYNFGQDDLLTEDVLILNTQAEVFVWVGQSVEPKEKQNAFEMGEKFVELATSLEGLSPKIPLYKLTEGYEPCFFTTYFSSWDSTRATVQGNSFQKKVTLLFGGNSAERSNQGGHTQRASALAALSSALNPSSEKRLSPRSSAGGQGSQRAAAMAALSQALTAEKKPSSPPGSPARTLSGNVVDEAQEDEEQPTTESNEEEENAFEGAIEGTYSYDQLTVKSENPVTGIDFKRREAYLSDEEFESVFGITKEEFYKMPGWKQDRQKKKFDLF